MIKVNVYFDDNYRYYDLRILGILVFRSKRKCHYDDYVRF